MSVHTDAVIATTPADATLAWWPHDFFGEPHLHTLRDVLLNVITEATCHTGHLDAARELIDGRRRLVLTQLCHLRRLVPCPFGGRSFGSVSLDRAVVHGEDHAAFWGELLETGPQHHYYVAE